MKMTRRQLLPDFFKPLLWSYDFSKIDPLQDKQAIVVNTINYGDLKHWKWIKNFYGQEMIRELLGHLPATEFRPQALKLASVLFHLDKFNDIPRGS